MTRQRIRKRASELLASAARDIELAVRVGVETGSPTEEELRDQSWQLTRLTGGLGDLAVWLAEEVGRFGDHRLLHDDRGGDGTRSLATASRELAAVRHALAAAETASREFYAALGHVAVDVDLDERRHHDQYR